MTDDTDLEEEATWETNVERIRELARHPDLGVRLALTQNDNAPEDVLALLATDASKSVRCLVAGVSRLPIETIDALASDAQWCVRVGVANRRDLPEELIERLLRDENGEVRAAVVGSAPWRLLPIDVVRDPCRGVRAAFVARRDLPDAIAAAFAADPDAWVRWRIALNASREVLFLLVDDIEPDVRAMARRRLGLPVAERARA